MWYFPHVAHAHLSHAAHTNLSLSASLVLPHGSRAICAPAAWVARRFFPPPHIHSPCCCPRIRLGAEQSRDCAELRFLPHLTSTHPAAALVSAWGQSSRGTALSYASCPTSHPLTLLLPSYPLGGRAVEGLR